MDESPHDRLLGRVRERRHGIRSAMGEVGQEVDALLPDRGSELVYEAFNVDIQAAD